MRTSPLNAALETVAAYGKRNPQAHPISNGTGTETGQSQVGLVEKHAEIVESIGAGGGI